MDHRLPGVAGPRSPRWKPLLGIDEVALAGQYVAVIWARDAQATHVLAVLPDRCAS